MAHKKLKTFTTYCTKPYDRHKYKIILKNKESIVLEDYEQVRAIWYQLRQHAERVEVID